MPNSATLHLATLLGILSLFMGLSVNLRAQSDGYENLTWTWADSVACQGDKSHFRWGEGFLHLDAPTGGTSELKRRIPALRDYAYQIDVGMAFNPSSSNYMEIQWRAEASESMLILRLGKTDDRLELWRAGPHEEVVLAASSSGILDLPAVDLSLVVKYGPDHRYTLGWSIQGSWNEVLSTPDSILLPPNEILLRAVYTASRSDKFSWSPITVTGKCPFTWPSPRAMDWHFTELLAKSAPLLPGWSPEQPFVEAVWTGPSPVLLDGWSLYVGSRAYPLPSFWVSAGETVVFGDSALADHIPAEARHVPLALSLPTASLLALKGPRGELWGSLTYDMSLVSPSDKASGGYSLEAHSLMQSCLPSEWQWSDDPSGATIGRPPDGEPRGIPTPPARLRIWGLGTSEPEVLVDFQMPMSPVHEATRDAWEWTGSTMASIHPYAWPLPGAVDSLRVPAGLCRCDGHPYPWDWLKVGWPVLPENAAIALTEWLLDPLPYEPRFVELKNMSPQVLEVGALFLADPEGAGFWRRLDEPGSFLLPGEVRAYSEEPKQTSKRYPSGSALQIWPSQEAIPPLSEKEGMGLFRSDGLRLAAVDPEKLLSSSGQEGVSWRWSAGERWVLSGDSASPGLHHVFEEVPVSWGAVRLEQGWYGGNLRPVVSYAWRQDGPWLVQERWTQAHLGVGAEWTQGVQVEREGLWECGLPPAPNGGVWLWDIRFTSPKGHVFRRSFEIRQVR